MKLTYYREVTHTEISVSQIYVMKLCIDVGSLSLEVFVISFSSDSFWNSYNTRELDTKKDFGVIGTERKTSSNIY